MRKKKLRTGLTPYEADRRIMTPTGGIKYKGIKYVIS
jgi:hypothetical protein